jgi:hypothetical protein
METLTLIVLFVIILAIFGLVAAAQAEDSRDSHVNDLPWPAFGDRIR